MIIFETDKKISEVRKKNMANRHSNPAYPHAKRVTWAFTHFQLLLRDEFLRIYTRLTNIDF